MKRFFSPFLPVVACLLLGACAGKNESPDPQPGQTAQDALPKTFTSSLQALTKAMEYDNQGRPLKQTTTTGTYKNQYDYWEYTDASVKVGYVIPPATQQTVMYEYTLKDGLPVERQSGPRWVISDKSRYFNYRFDAERHLLGYEYEFRRQSNNALVEAMRFEYTWQDGNMVRMKRFNTQTGQLEADVSYEYDLTKLNRLFSGFYVDRPLLSVENSAIELPLTGTGVKNVLKRGYKTGGTPGKAYTYTFDAQDRITSITTPSGAYSLSLTY